MYGIENKNTGKLLAAVLVMAMVIAGAAVVFSEETQAATVEEETFLGNIESGVYTVEGAQEVTISGPLTGLTKITGASSASLTINYTPTDKYQSMIVVDNDKGLVIENVTVKFNMLASDSLTNAADGLTVFGGAIVKDLPTDSTGSVTVQNGAKVSIPPKRSLETMPSHMSLESISMV